MIACTVFAAGFRLNTLNGNLEELRVAHSTHEGEAIGMDVANVDKQEDNGEEKEDKVAKEALSRRPFHRVGKGVRAGGVMAPAGLGMPAGVAPMPAALKGVAPMPATLQPMPATPQR